MDRPIDISRYQPSLLRPVQEFQELARIENGELTEIQEGIKIVFENQYIDTLTVYGCKKWEKMLQISPKGTDSLEVRRFRIKAKLNERLPYTYRMLLLNLDTLCGTGKYQVSLFPESYYLEILLQLTIKKMREEVAAMARRLCPANIVLAIGLQYHQWETASILTYHQSNGFTWRQLKEESLPTAKSYGQIKGKTHQSLSSYTHKHLSDYQNPLQQYTGLIEKTHQKLTAYTYDSITNKLF